MNWWESVDAVKSANSKLTLAFAVLGVLAAVFGMLAWFTSERVTTLQGRNEDALRDRLQSAESEVAAQKRTAEELQERLKARSLSDAARKRLLAVLSSAPGGPVTVSAAMSNQEAESFARQILDVLRTAGWSPTGVNLSMMIPGPSGIVIRVHDAQAVPAHAGPIQHAFEAAGFPAQGSAGGAVPVGTVDIYVGYKPQ